MFDEKIWYYRGENELTFFLIFFIVRIYCFSALKFDSKLEENCDLAYASRLFFSNVFTKFL